MKKIFTLLVIVIGSASICHGQIGIAYHQSNLPFVGINYEFKDRFRVEPRIGVDNFLDDVSIELIATYDVVNKQDFEIYAGFGLRAGDFSGPVVPVGLNLFPFEDKRFGFHMEIAAVAFFEDDSVLRGSWGIRYRFLRREK